jgi:L-lactate dehydrogenase complex protein LldG
MSRENILARLKRHRQPATKQIASHVTHSTYADAKSTFMQVVTAIGGRVFEIKSDGIRASIESLFPSVINLVSTVSAVDTTVRWSDPKSLETVQVVVLSGEFGVAENGAIWITDRSLPERVLPFICEHLVLVIERSKIVSNMGEAYNIIGQSDYEFGTFISGPSKTADIEQSLVLGAHGAKTLTVLLVE